MYNLIKTICINNNYIFTYARKDFMNLFDEEEQLDVPHLFLDPVTVDTIFDEYNSVESKTYSGSLMVLYSSSIDEEDYDTRYQNYIKPIVSGASATIKSAIQCDGIYTINNWREVEVINAFDYNLDGIIITYNINE